MHTSFRWFICLGGCATLVLATASRASHAEEERAKPPSNRSAAVARVREIIEAVMEHHVAPPTRQQMILEALRGLAEVSSQRLPSDISSRISSISDVDELYKLLESEGQRQIDGADSLVHFIDSDWKLDEKIRSRISRAVPGGLQFTPSRSHAVNEQIAANRYGIGVRTIADRQNRRPRFTDVMPGGSAAAAGLKAGDIVEAVDGKDTGGVSIGGVIQWIRGPEGSAVRLSVRSEGEEPRDVSLVRRVVPMQTLKVIEHADNEAAALIQLDRLSASTVHELRKIINALPESATTIILDVRQSTTNNLHYTHLLADALLDEADLGTVESRLGTRSLRTEAGTILEGRTVAMVYYAGKSGQMDWLARALDDHGVAIYCEDFSKYRLRANRDLVTEFMPMQSGTIVMGLATGRLQTANRTPLDNENLAGRFIKNDRRRDNSNKPYTAKANWEGRIEFSKNSNALKSVQGFPILRRAILTDATADRSNLIDQIMSDRVHRRN